MKKQYSILTAMMLALVLAVGTNACAPKSGGDDAATGQGTYCPKEKGECRGEEGAEGRVCPHKKKCAGEDGVCPHKKQRECAGGEACAPADCPGGADCPHADCPYKKKCKGERAEGECHHKKKCRGEERECPRKEKCKGAPDEAADDDAAEEAPTAQ